MKLISKVIVGVVSALALTGTTLGGIAIGQKGIPGETGPQGEQGPKGETGAQGPQGEKGDTGAAGKSAYEIAKAGGYTGTEAQWIASLKGEAGGKGDTGATGKSAYEIAKAGGYTGTEAQWIVSLKGDKGADGKTAYELYKDLVPTGETPLSQSEWLATLIGSNGKSAYEIYCEENPEYDGTEEDFAKLFDGLINKGNSTYATWSEIIKMQNLSMAHLTFNDAMPTSEWDVDNATGGYSFILNTDITCDIDTVIDIDIDEQMVGKTHAELDGNAEGGPRLKIETYVNNVEGEDEHFSYKDDIYFTPVSTTAGIKYFMFFTCNCYGSPEKYRIEIPSQYLYKKLLAIVVRDLHLSATSFQFERFNYNVLNTEDFGLADSTNKLIGRIASSEYYADMENFEFSMINNDENFGFEYKYKYDAEGLEIITNTDTKIKNYEFNAADVRGELNAHTNLALAENELETITEEQILEYSTKYYSFGQVLYHSAGNVLNCMFIPCDDFEYGLSEETYYFKHKQPTAPEYVNAYCTSSYFVVGDEFNPYSIDVRVKYDVEDEFEASYSEKYETGCFNIDTHNLPLDNEGKFTIPGTYEINVMYCYGIDEDSNLETNNKVLINVRENPEDKAVDRELCVINGKPNYKVGEEFDEHSIAVMRIIRDVYGKSEPQTEIVLPFDESTNINGYIIADSNLESDMFPPVDMYGKFTTPGTYEIIVVTPDGFIGKTTINIQAIEPEFAVFTAHGNKVGNYVVGDEFLLSDIVVIGYDKELNPTYVDVNDCIFDSNAPMSHGKFTTPGTYTCMVAFENYFAQFEFTVDPAAVGEPKLVNLCLEGQTLNLIQGNDFEVGDLQVTGYYADGTSAKIEAYDEQTNPNGYTVDDSEVNMFNVGIYPVYVSVGNLKVTYYVFVNDVEPQ